VQRNSKILRRGKPTGGKKEGALGAGKRQETNGKKGVAKLVSGNSEKSKEGNMRRKGGLAEKKKVQCGHGNRREIQH